MIAIVVANCATCPFCSDGEPEEPWLCDAAGAVDGQSDPRVLPEQRHLPGGWPDPPDWCPLREADHLVTLRVRRPT